MKLRWRLSKPLENQKQQDMETGFTLDERTKKVIKSGLVWLGAFTAYRLYKLYEVSESVIYKPVGLSFIRGTNLNDFVVRVKMEILNPEKTIVYLRGIDGRLFVQDKTTGLPQTLGYFTSGKTTIRPGLNYMSLDFRIDPTTAGVQLIQALIQKKAPVLYVEMNTKLPFFSTKDTFAVNPETVQGAGGGVFVK